MHCWSFHLLILLSTDSGRDKNSWQSVGPCVNYLFVPERENNTEKTALVCLACWGLVWKAGLGPDNESHKSHWENGHEAKGTRQRTRDTRQRDGGPLVTIRLAPQNLHSTLRPIPGQTSTWCVGSRCVMSQNSWGWRTSRVGWVPTRRGTHQSEMPLMARRGRRISHPTYHSGSPFPSSEKNRTEQYRTFQKRGQQWKQMGS